ncbi:MAG TPA: hypothetical protein VGF84_22260 [Micromonosporaceae bacterium]|jgi:hypothetical protein
MEREPNVALLQHIRTAAWSDKGTARRVNAERLRRGRPSGYDGANVRGWLRGVVPDPLTRDVLAYLLSVALDRRVTVADLGFAGDASPRTGLDWQDSLDATIEDVARLWRAPEGTTYPLTHGAYTTPTRDWLLAWPEPAVSEHSGARGSRRIGREEVDVLWAACETYQEMERRLGAGNVRTTASHLLTDVVTPMLRARFTDDVGARLMGVAARLTDILGYAAYDGLEDGLAQRYFIQSLRLARAAGDDALAAHIFGDMARHATHIGDLREALALARAGQQAARAGGSPADRARNASLESRVLAMLDLPRESAAAMATAERTLSTVDYEDAPAWVRYFTTEQMHSEFAHIAAASGRHTEVLRFAAVPMTAHGKLQRRTALLATAVARAHLGVGALDEATSTASTVLDLSEGLASRRVAREVRTLCDAVATLLPPSSGNRLRRRALIGSD